MKWKNGFYCDLEAPVGAVSLTNEEYENLLKGQEQGLTIEDENGKPVLKDYRTDQSIINSKKLNMQYVPSESDSLKAFAKLYLQTASIKDDDVKLSISGICDDWKLGNHVKGELVNISGQTWECYTAHDNSVYPDIIPTNSQTWANFWRPLHGKTKETARPWCKPVNGTTDIYHVGEYMIWTDQSIKKCLRDTNYSPEEYAADWEDVM